VFGEQVVDPTCDAGELPSSSAASAGVLDAPQHAGRETVEHAERARYYCRAEPDDLHASIVPKQNRTLPHVRR
jgi:hypothetical protein